MKVINGIEYTHKGLLCGIAPVYIAEIESEAPILAERHWSLLPLMLLAELLFAMFCIVAQFIIKDFEPVYPIRITGEL